MRFFTFLLFLSLCFNCKNAQSEQLVADDTSDVSAISTKDFREFKVLDSKYIDNEAMWQPFEKDLKDFTEEVYNNLKSFILEQDIPTIQQHILHQKLSYEDLVKFYLYRIRKYDRENELSLNSVISLNPNVIKEAKGFDKVKNIYAQPNSKEKFMRSLYGMPILLKDNVNTKGMPTTAGAVALQHNATDDAFIVERLKEKGAIILGKANLSEWAYYFCGDCPSGYSAIGGQTLNPYGRRIMDTGGSSSGSGVAVAANFAVAAIGSETSGSILSPASQNSVVGLKPTIGLVSRSGIVPISSTLDTAGPMAKNVTDTAILLDAIFGYDKTDSKSINPKQDSYYFTNNLGASTLKGKRFGAVKRLLEDSLYVKAIADLKSKGAIIVDIDEENIELPDFLRLLNLDMKADLPNYLTSYAGNDVTVKTVEDVINFNLKDSLNRMPYGQKLFYGIVADIATDDEFLIVKNTLKTNGRQYFNVPFAKYNLDAFLSINNYHAGFAAVAEYPALTVPMGYTVEGKPKGLTFIGKPLKEKQLLDWAYNYEQAFKRRKTPINYD
ncbi:amidase family protein [Jejuia pallidilutea]|uniref:Amidase family protein n=1 Tax=Jejuia pallidilutea TaxID=504487 RepID=A0A098LVB6_9FLAO|nr:amidase family protein [Jejuia pallidilutea]GAL90866.1 amidase family protein [Jejuia pallidilutea]